MKRIAHIAIALACLAGPGTTKDVNLSVPLVVRLEGTNVDLGKDILERSKLPIESADDLKGLNPDALGQP